MSAARSRPLRKGCRIGNPVKKIIEKISERTDGRNADAIPAARRSASAGTRSSDYGDQLGFETDVTELTGML